MAEYQGPYSGAQVDTALKAALELQPKVSKIDSEVAEHRKTIKSLSETKADTTGYYPQMSVGQADNLPDRGDVVEGLLGFRESAGAGNSIEDGTANVQELLGESLVWNQRSDSKNYGNNTIAGESSLVINGTFAEFNASIGAEKAGVNLRGVGAVLGHKYIISLNLQTNQALVLYTLGKRSTGLNSDTAFIVEAIDTITYLIMSNILTEELTFKARILLTDLTQMFGAGNEPTTVEEFEAIKNQLVGVDFTAYNAGEVLGVNIKGIKSVNDNAWDEEWEAGSLSSVTGLPTTASSAIRAKDFIKVLPSYDYYVTAPTEIQDNIRLYFYDADKNFIERGFDINEVFTTPSNAHYMKLIVNSTTTYNHDICIRLAHSGYKTDYVAHEESESPFDLTPYFPDGMHGINGVRDSVTKSKAVRRFGVVDLGTLNWIYDTTFASYNLRADVSKLGFMGASATMLQSLMLCSRYITSPYTGTGSAVDKTIKIYTNTQLRVLDSAYTDAATFKAAMSGVYLVYELATPIETDIDPQLNMNYKVWDFGTEELLTDSKSAPVLARTIYGFNATDTIRGNKAKNEEQDARLSDLENEVVRVGDYQPDLSVGVADNLAGTDYTESEIGFRRSGGGAILDGAARVSSVKGNSVVWNQKARAITKPSSKNGVTIVRNEDGSFTISGSAEADTRIQVSVNFPNNPTHKYCMLGCPPNGSMSTYRLEENYYGKKDSGTGFIGILGSGEANCSLGIVVSANYSITSPLIFTPRLIDLTLMFGAGNEPTTIEEFYARKPKVADENAFNEGEVIHMEADAIKSVGVNQWDEEWEVGVFLDNGTIYTASGYDVAIHSKNHINVIEGSTYQFTYPYNGTLYICLYDSAKTFIRREIISNVHTYTIPNGVRYIRIATEKTYNSSTYKNDICINLSDTEVNGQYFPYVKREQSLEVIKKYFPQGMKSAGTAHDEIRWNEQKQKWEAIKRIGEVDMGTLPFALNYADTFHVFVVYHMQNIVDNFPNHRAGGIGALCSKYISAPWSFIADYTNNNNDNTFCLSDSAMGTNALIIRDTSYTDAASFKAAMSGVILYYELAKPDVKEIDENFNLDYEVWNAGTEQMIADTPSTPVKASIAYGFNAVGKIKQLEEIIAQLQTAIANLSNS